MLKLSLQVFAGCAVIALFAMPLFAAEDVMPPAPPALTSEAPVPVAAPTPTQTPEAVPAPVATTAPEPIPAPTPTAAADLVPPQTGATIELDGSLPASKFPLIRLTPDKIEVLRLDRDAVNVIVGNSNHLLSVLETPRQILLIPRQPGATHFQALDAKGETIMERSVIIASPKQDYVRVRRACSSAAGGKDCAEFSVYYCPDMCHEVSVTQKTKSGGNTGTVNIPETTASTPQVEDTINDGVPIVDDTASGADSVGGKIGAATGVQ